MATTAAPANGDRRPHRPGRQGSSSTLPQDYVRAVPLVDDAEIAANETVFSDLRAVFINGTLKPSPAPSHTDGLIAVSAHVLAGMGARVDTVRLVDRTIPPGVAPDMREHGFDVDDFPDLYRELIEPARIVVLATPIWLGDQSSMTRKALRLVRQAQRRRSVVLLRQDRRRPRHG